MKLIGTFLILAVSFALAGCAIHRSEHHVLKLDRTHEHIINNPYEWALQQFANGPISGSDVSDYARLVLTNGLKQALADLGGDETQELLLRQDCPARVWEVLTFTPVKGGYRYFGHFPAGLVVPNTVRSSVLVYEPCGGHYGFIKTYKHDGDKFVCHSTEDITVGDGTPDESNRKLGELFPKGKVIKWAKTPTKLVASDGL